MRTCDERGISAQWGEQKRYRQSLKKKKKTRQGCNDVASVKTPPTDSTSVARLPPRARPGRRRKSKRPNSEGGIGRRKTHGERLDGRLEKARENGITGKELNEEHEQDAKSGNDGDAKREKRESHPEGKKKRRTRGGEEREKRRNEETGGLREMSFFPTQSVFPVARSGAARRGAAFLPELFSHLIRFGLNVEHRRDRAVSEPTDEPTDQPSKQAASQPADTWTDSLGGYLDGGLTGNKSPFSPAVRFARSLVRSVVRPCFRPFVRRFVYSLYKSRRHGPMEAEHRAGRRRVGGSGVRSRARRLDEINAIHVSLAAAGLLACPVVSTPERIPEIRTAEATVTRTLE